MSSRPVVVVGMVVALVMLIGNTAVHAGGPVCRPQVLPSAPYAPPMAPVGCGPLPARPICPESAFQRVLEGTVDLAASVFASPFKLLDACQDKFFCPPSCLPGQVQQYRPPSCAPLCPVPAWRPAPLFCPPPACVPVPCASPGPAPMQYRPLVKPYPGTPHPPKPYSRGPRSMSGNSPIQPARPLARTPEAYR